MNDGVVEFDGHDVSDRTNSAAGTAARRKDFHSIGVSFSRKSFVSAAPPCASSALASFHTSTTVMWFGRLFCCSASKRTFPALLRVESTSACTA